MAKRKFAVSSQLSRVLSIALGVAHLANGNKTTETIDAVGGCTFMHDQPRYYQLLSTLTLQNAMGSDTLINDALIRALRRRLMVAECQIMLSEGSPCTSGTRDLPCADPVHVCSLGEAQAFSSTPLPNQVVLTDDVHDAIVFESCDNNGDGLVDALDGTMDTLVCGQVLEVDTAVQTMVKQGSCTAVCDVDALLRGESTALDIEDSAEASTCLSFDLTLNVATEQAAVGLQGELVSEGVGALVQMTLSGFASAQLEFSIVESTIVDTVGFGFFPPPPPPPPPLKELIASADASNAGVSPADVSKTLVFGDWSPCYPSCGDGFSTRTVSCMDGIGAILPLADCPGGLLAEASKACSTPCELPYWQYGPWQTCDRRCGTGQSARTATCVSDGLSKCSAGDREPLAKECNTVPCDVFSWVQTPWSDCSAPCGGGTQTRNVTCVDSTGNTLPDSSCDASRMPPTSQVCNARPCNFCASNTCLGRGECFDGQCQCNKDYRGDHCEVHSSCKAGVVSANLACCTSGVLDSRGGCCPDGSSVDDAGDCCEGTVDACGVCNGEGKFVDIQGQCCAVVDADGICCASAMVDECGVCNGVGNTCNIVLGLNMRVPADIVANNTVQPATIDAYLDMIANLTGISPERISIGDIALSDGGSSLSGRKLMQSTEAVSEHTSLLVQVEIAPDVSQPTDVPFSSAYYAQILPEASEKYGSEKFGIESVPISSRSGVCGNGICELGERPIEGASTVPTGTCAEDCGLPSKLCPDGCSNGGVCLPSSGVCQCRAEYTGVSCGDCADGYKMNGDNSACVLSVADQGIISGSVLGENGEALVSGTESSGTSAGVIVGAVFGAFIGAATLIFVSILVWKRCTYGARKPQLTSNKLSQSRPESSDASGLGLRKKYGLAPYAFGYSDGLEITDQIRAGQYQNFNGNPTFEEDHGCYEAGYGGDSGNQRDAPGHRVMYMTQTTVDPTSSDENSGFQANLYVKHPSPDRIRLKVVHDEQRDFDDHSGYIKAAEMPLEQITTYQPHEDPDMFGDQEIQGNAAQSLGETYRSMGSRENSPSSYDDDMPDCASIGSESRMRFNPTFNMHEVIVQHQDEYPKTVLVQRRGDVTELDELDARRQKLDALRAAVRSLENSRAPSRETSFTGTALDSENMVDLESLAGRSLPARPDTVPDLNLARMHEGIKAIASVDDTTFLSNMPTTNAEATKPVVEKEPTSFFGTLKRALTPPRFRRPISSTSDCMGETDIARSSMGSFTQVLEAVDNALSGRGDASSRRDHPKKTTFDAKNF